MTNFNRQQVEAEMERAKVAEDTTNPIPEGGSYPSFEDIYPQLDNKDLSRADLSELDLANANLNNSNLRETNLDKTRLVMAELKHADLSNTTQMEGTDLRGADMSFTKLQGANLSRAILEGNDPPLFESTSSLILSDAQYDEQTTWPPGFKPDNYGARHVGE